MTSSLLWTLSQDQINQSDLKAFTSHLKAYHDLDIKIIKTFINGRLMSVKRFGKVFWIFVWSYRIKPK